MAKSNAEHGKALRERTVAVPTELDEEGLPLIVQPPAGIGCKMEPKRYQNIVLDLASGMSILDVAEKHSVGSSTVHLLRKRHDDICPGHRKVMNQKMEEMKEQLIASMRGDLEDGRMPRGIKPLAFGIISDKHAASEANGVVRHAHLHAFVPQTEVTSMLDGLAAPKEDKKSSHSTEKAHKTGPIIDISPNSAQNDPESAIKSEGGEGGADSDLSERLTDKPT
jgi:hypothetical protein